MAYLLITNSEQTKYASLTNGLASQYSMKNNQYPKSIVSATDIMRNHCHDDAGKQKERRKGKPKEKDKDESKDEEDQPPQTGNDANFAKRGSLREGTCYCCGKAGHISPDCPDAANTPKSQWYLKAASQHMCAESQQGSQRNEGS